MWIDISVPLKNKMVHWPGDPEVKIHNVMDLKKGDLATISKIDMGSHTGTHMDSPSHFIKNARTIDQMPPEATMGPARVLEIRDPVSIKLVELRKFMIRRGERILFKTKNSARCWKSNKFVKDFVFISLEAAEFLGKTGVRCVGVDYLSVGGFSADGAAIHRALLSRGVWIIEGLSLSKVKPGRHELICLPLKIFNGDGAPARAFLKK